MGSTKVSPGMSYYGMLALIKAVRYPQLPTAFTNELFLSLFWEETFFNNMRQTGAGTAVGFGQVEPSEFLKFHGGNPDDDERLDQANRVFRQDKRAKAKSFGYFVDYGLLPTTTYFVPALDKSGQPKMKDGKPVMVRRVKLADGVKLSDTVSVKLAMAAMHQVYVEKNKGSTAISAYGGVGNNTPGDPFSTSTRQGKLASIQACEKLLLNTPAGLKGEEWEDYILRALHTAKPYLLEGVKSGGVRPKAPAGWREILFDPLSSRY